MTACPGLLFIAPWFLFPSNTGERIRTRDILRSLKNGRFEITLVSTSPGVLLNSVGFALVTAAKLSNN